MRAVQVCRPYEMRESSGLAVGSDDPGGPRAHTVRPYEEEGELPRRAGEDTRPYGRADIETVSFFS